MNRLLNFFLGTIIALILVQSADAESWPPPRDYAAPDRAPAAGTHPSNAPTKFETVPPNEAEQIAEIVSLTTQLLQQRYPESMARRSVHPKDRGCIKAAFTVNSDIPQNYRVGVFATLAKTYYAWIRFSNSTPTLGPDFEKVSRGMAIKLMGVEGYTLLSDPSAKT